MANNNFFKKYKWVIIIVAFLLITSQQDKKQGIGGFGCSGGSSPGETCTLYSIEPDSLGGYNLEQLNTFGSFPSNCEIQQTSVFCPSLEYYLTAVGNPEDYLGISLNTGGDICNIEDNYQNFQDTVVDGMVFKYSKHKGFTILKLGDVNGYVSNYLVCVGKYKVVAGRESIAEKYIDTYGRQNCN